MLRTFGDNPTCKHIIFGGCHDAGYLPNLDRYKHNDAKASRITLLESTTAAWGYAELPNFKRARFDSVFRTEELPASLRAVTQVQPTLSHPARANAGSPELSSFRNLATSANPTLSPSSVVLSPHASVFNENSSSWATVGKSGNINGTINLKPTPPPKMRYIYYNRDGQRLDEQLPTRERGAMEAIERRMNQVSSFL
jgi:hypothetical protein